MSSNRFLTLINGVMTWIEAIATSAGATDANKIIRTTSTGRLDSSLMPTGIGADTQSGTASEALAAGSFVNITSAGAIRLADNSNNRPAHGFVTAAVANAATATVFRGGRNPALTGLTPGVRYFLGTAGAATTTAPIAVGSIIQGLGVAGDAGSITFEYDEPTLIA